MTVIRRAHGLELVLLAAGTDVNDDRDVYAIREQGDTADLFSTYDRAAALRQWRHELHVRRVSVRAA